MPGHALDVVLDPPLLFGILDVHVLDADRSAVGVAKGVEHVAERELVVVAYPLDDEAPVEVEDGDAVGERVELRVELGRHGSEGVEIGHEVAAHAEQVDELLHPRLLHEPGVDALAGADRIDVVVPTRRVVGNSEREEHLVVEVVLADQQLVHTGEEQPRLGPLDDAVVVGGRDYDDLAHPKLGEHLRVRRCVLRRVAERSDSDDGALARHEARHGLRRAERAGIRDRDRHAGEVVGRQLVRAHLANQVLVGMEELGEIEQVCVLHARHEQGPATAGALVVDRDPEADVLVADHARRAGPVDFRHERSVHHGHDRERLDHRPGDQVSEADLAAGRPRELVVDDRAVDLEQLGGYGMNAGGRRDRKAGAHVLDDPGRGSAECERDLARRRGLWRRPGHRRDRGRTGGRRCRSRTRRRYGFGGLDAGPGRLGSAAAPVVGEELSPALADRLGISQVGLVHLLDEPGVCPVSTRKPVTA